MFAPRRTLGARSVVATVALLVGLGLTACGSSDTPPASSSAPPYSATGALPLTERVVSDDLAGLARSADVQEVTTADEYAALINPDGEDPDLAQERKLDAELASQHGFVRAAVKSFGANAAGSGTSVALQLNSPEQAKAYEQQVYEEQFSSDPADPTDPLNGAERGTIPGAAQSHTVIASAEDEGLTNTLVFASFVDGPFVYVQSAGGTDPTVTKVQARSTIDQAKALYTKVKDRPAP